MPYKHIRAVTVLLGAAILYACTASSSVTENAVIGLKPDLICHNTERFSGKVIGDGHCVSLIKKCTGAPLTSYWRPGPKVLSSKIPSGTIIATFQNGRYPSRKGHHAAIYIEHSEEGIWVWDQWQGKAVHKRLIRVRDDRAPASNSANKYHVVRLP